MFRGIDFYSDTVTRPSQGMREAMVQAEVGDEQKGEDPTTRALEERVAQLVGKETATFFPSATMANEIAILLFCERGDELVAAENCHLFTAEAGGPAFHAGALARPILSPTGIFDGDAVRAASTPRLGPHYPVTRLVSVENTTNGGGGLAWPLEKLADVTRTARELGLACHMDGARLMNAAVRSGVPAKRVTEGFSTVTLCLSKGLGCPAGAVLSYPKEMYPRVRRLKQLMGGALRQSGILAAAGLYALEHNVTRLQEDHDNARLLARAIHDNCPGLVVENLEPDTNMVYFRQQTPKRTDDQFLKACESRGVRFSWMGPNRYRGVTHLDVSREDIQKGTAILRQVCLDG